MGPKTGPPDPVSSSFGPPRLVPGQTISGHPRSHGTPVDPLLLLYVLRHRTTSPDPPSHTSVGVVPLRSRPSYTTKPSPTPPAVVARPRVTRCGTRRTADVREGRSVRPKVEGYLSDWSEKTPRGLGEKRFGLSAWRRKSSDLGRDVDRGTGTDGKGARKRNYGSERTSGVPEKSERHRPDPGVISK